MAFLKVPVAMRLKSQSRSYPLDRVSWSTKRVVHRYPHEFSGGQRQRIGIARAQPQATTDRS